MSLKTSRIPSTRFIQSFQTITGEHLNLYEIVFKINIGRLNSNKAMSASPSSIEAYTGLNRFLMAFFDKNLKEFQYTVRTKTYSEIIGGVATLDFLQGSTTNIASTMYNEELAWTRVLFYGIETHLLFFYCLLYTVVDIYSSEGYMPLAVVFLFDVGLVFIRNYFGEFNISSKTLLDRKFLL